MITFLTKKSVLDGFIDESTNHVKRARKQRTHPNSLDKVASSSYEHLRGQYVKIILQPSHKYRRNQSKQNVNKPNKAKTQKDYKDYTMKPSFVN